MDDLTCSPELAAEIMDIATINPFASLATELAVIANQLTGANREHLLDIADALNDLAHEIRTEFRVTTSWGKPWGTGGDAEWLIGNVPFMELDGDNQPFDIHERWVSGWEPSTINVGDDEPGTIITW